MKCVVEYLENSAKKNENKIAVIEEENRYTYKQLLNDSKVIGSGLVNLIKPQEPVIVFMDKGYNALVSFFGSIYAGGFYSLLNPDLPIERIEKIANTLDSKVVITDPIHLARAKEILKDKNILLVTDLLKGTIDLEKLENRFRNQISTDPVYANFTSGSTGTPKGVVVGNRSIIDFIDVFTKEFDINENDIIANQAPFDFDVSVKDIYSSIKVGATLLIVPKRLFSNPTELIDYLVSNKATTMTWAVSALCLISTFHGLEYKNLDTVNKVLFSGEIMPMKHLTNWMEHLTTAKFVNLYGPTEITCNCTYHVIDRNRNYEHGIPIGNSFYNERVILLDENDNEIIEDNKTGEICVIGDCLGLGYYKNREETDKHFVQNPLNKAFNESMYRTGDLGIYKNGELYFQGRKDFQIKHMGHRIELEEIEIEMNKVEGVNRCCCVYDENKSRLYAFYVGTADKKEIHSKMKEKLPIYMVPNQMIQIEEFELNKNGKIDRKKLKEMVGI